MLRQELVEIWGDDAAGLLAADPSSLEQCYEVALAKNQAALCLSGGGVRSAAFGLGVIQALAKKKLLTQFHYLSTVSGGGYVGGFLTRWIHALDGKADDVQLELDNAATPGKPEPSPIQWLREHSNFLTPRTGLASADTWSAAVLWIRNTLINWFVFLPAFLLAVAIPNLYLAILLTVSPLWADGAAIASFLLIAAATYFTAREVPSHAAAPAQPGRIRWRIVIPSLLASFVLPMALAPYLLFDGGPSGEHGLGVAFISSVLSTPDVAASVFGGAVMALGLIIGYVAAWIASQRIGFGRNLHIWIIGAAFSGAAVAWTAFLVSTLDYSCEAETQTDAICNWRGSIYVSLLPLCIVVSQLLLTIFYTAFRRVPNTSELLTKTRGSSDGPRFSPDLDREWLARLSAIKLRMAVVIAVFSALTLIGPILFSKFGPYLGSWLTGVLGAGSGLTAVWGGSAAASDDPTATGWRKFLTFNRIVILATLVFIALMTLLLASAETFLAAKIVAYADWAPSWVAGGVDWVIRCLGRALPDWPLIYAHLILVALFGLVLWHTSKKISVNRFSLNSVYRNRIGRAFLGATRPVREPDPFTSFDPADNARMGDLTRAAHKLPRRVLFPVINLALNLVGTKRLAWQERKAHSFTVTPLTCGSAVLRPLEPGKDGRGAYVHTKDYAGREADERFSGDGISLATAMAISGAAASPNMGYNSSPATAFLMTLFNVRLGAWLPNPSYEGFTLLDMMRSSPTNALRPFLRELTGQTNDEAMDIYLSDGGHFENLGIYEMIRRRCRYIFVSDAGFDPDAKFEDLGNAIRKIMADLDGVAITFRELKIVSRKLSSADHPSFAVGEINYGKDVTGKKDEIGHLIYVKPSYFVDKVSVDIRSYANLNEAFPHEPTSDQWFSESQFESYRRLGELLVSALSEKSYGASGIAQFFKDVSPHRVDDPA